MILHHNSITCLLKNHLGITRLSKYVRIATESLSNMTIKLRRRSPATIIRIMPPSSSAYWQRPPNNCQYRSREMIRPDWKRNEQVFLKNLIISLQIIPSLDAERSPSDKRALLSNVSFGIIILTSNLYPFFRFRFSSYSKSH